MLYDWMFWRLTRLTDGELEWLGATRTHARTAIDRDTMWTLIPNRAAFIVNWWVTEDHRRHDDAGIWRHENIDVKEAREIALDAPVLSAPELLRLTRPESGLTLAQINRRPVGELLGKRVARQLADRR